jgi:cell fate regulator YaaT (PSP1 superfamily)
MAHMEYLVGFGLTGDFGRFRASGLLDLPRGSRVVIRSERGVEVGQVLRPATERAARFLGQAQVGELLRPAGPDDEEQSRQMRQRAAKLLSRGGMLAQEQGFPVALLDAEVLLAGTRAVLHIVRWGECDLRELVRPLSVEFGLSITLVELGAPAEVHEEGHGCGSCGSGGCGSCGSGGCGTGCGVARPEEVSAYFAELREKMERRRVSLL